MENNDFAKDSTQQGTSISTSRKHNIEESNIQPQNDGKSTYNNYVLLLYHFLKTYTFLYSKIGKRIKAEYVG